MAQVELNAEARTITGKQVRHMRREGIIPAVLYGPGFESRSLQLNAKEAEKALRQAGTSQLIALVIDGKKPPVQILIRTLQRHATGRNLIHLDLYQVEMTKTLTVEVPIVLIGESPIVARNDGILLQGAQSVEIECLPGDLIDAIEVDLSELTAIDQMVTIADLALPSAIRILSNMDEMIVRVNPPQVQPMTEEEEAAAAAAAVTTAEPELVARRKAEEVED
jgi:large subunit ribosomal protein L25